MSVAPDSKVSWTTRARELALGALPPEKLLPDGQPTYVASSRERHPSIVTVLPSRFL